MSQSDLNRQLEKYKDTVAEPFVGHRERSQQRRASNRASSAELLQDYGVSFEDKNNGAHLIVEHKDIVVDFWPGTGRFQRRNSTKGGRGIFNLLRLLEIDLDAVKMYDRVEIIDGICKGQIGTVVLIYKNRAAFEIELDADCDDGTLTAFPAQVRKIKEK